MSPRKALLVAIGALAFTAAAGAAPDAEAAKSAKTAKGPKTGKRKVAAKATRKAPKAEAQAKEEPAVQAFDREAAALAISSVDLTKCRAPNAEKGEGHVMITFATSGAATVATVDRGPWLGTPLAKCIAGQFRKTKVPVFGGEAVMVGKTFRFE